MLYTQSSRNGPGGQRRKIKIHFILSGMEREGENRKSTWSNRFPSFSFYNIQCVKDGTGLGGLILGFLLCFLLI